MTMTRLLLEDVVAMTMTRLLLEDVVEEDVQSKKVRENYHSGHNGRHHVALELLCYISSFVKI